MKAMKFASIISGALFIIFVVLLLMQIWFDILGWEIFFKVAITFAIVIVTVVIIALLFREYIEEKSMSEDKYID